MSQLLKWKSAADYCRLPEVYFRNQVRAGAGPTMIHLSTRQVFFATEDLDSWIRSWCRIEATAKPKPLHP